MSLLIAYDRANHYLLERIIIYILKWEFITDLDSQRNSTLISA